VNLSTNGYDVAISSGLIGMQMQGALSIFTVNLKRIIKLKSMKYPHIGYFMLFLFKLKNFTEKRALFQWPRSN